MKVILKPDNSKISDISSAFIRGKNPEYWFKEINSWNIDLKSFDCYLIPELGKSSETHGLFIIFKNNVDSNKFISPYQKVSEKLHIPINTKLFPEIKKKELDNILLWDIQIFHPTIGLIGLNKEDKIDLTEFINLKQEKNEDWNMAQSGILPNPKLTKIEILKPSIEDVINLIKQAIESKPLEEIKKLDNEDEKKKSGIDFVDKLKEKIYNSALNLTQKINEYSTKNISDYYENNNSNYGEGIIERFENWLKENILQIQEKRNDEIKKLLNLFDENTDEALKYAISLDSPYLNRGKANSSSKLSKHSTNFNLNKIGGGGRVDNWNIDNYYYELRNKYLKAAAKEILEKNYQKAAYIYANLLGDFNAAANVLEQGKFYREAASLYKDHLKNTLAAANCLENGGLILEAIELYEKINMFEKVGDLYIKINMNEQAELYYEKLVSILIENEDYLSASDIVGEKLGQREREKEILIEGWNKSIDAKFCLIKYFDLTLSNEISNKVQEIYKDIDNPIKEEIFFQILIEINKSNNNSDLINISRQIAYKIVNTQAERGNFKNLHTLKIFLPDDRLITSDILRFKTNNKEISEKVDAFYLKNDIEWFQIINHHNQYVIFGKKNYDFYLVRGNWYGDFEYYNWHSMNQYNYLYNFISNPIISDNILVQASDEYLEAKLLHKNSKFDNSLIIRFPHAFQNNLSINDYVISIGIINESEFSILKENEMGLTMQIYNFSNILKMTIDCKINPETMSLIQSVPRSLTSEMKYIDNTYYTFKNNILIIISDDYYVKTYILTEQIIDTVYFYDHFILRIAIKAEENFFICDYYDNKIQINKFLKQKIEYVDMKFINENILIISENYRAFIYNFLKGKESLVFTSDAAIVGILTTNNRYQCAFLDIKGKISLVDIKSFF